MRRALSDRAERRAGTPAGRWAADFGDPADWKPAAANVRWRHAPDPGPALLHVRHAFHDRLPDGAGSRLLGMADAAGLPYVLWAPDAVVPVTVTAVRVRGAVLADGSRAVVCHPSTLALVSCPDLHEQPFTLPAGWLAAAPLPARVRVLSERVWLSLPSTSRTPARPGSGQ